jgi:hypothetical protein
MLVGLVGVCCALLIQGSDGRHLKGQPDRFSHRRLPGQGSLQYSPTWTGGVGGIWI